MISGYKFFSNTYHENCGKNFFKMEHNNNNYFSSLTLVNKWLRPFVKADVVVNAASNMLKHYIKKKHCQSVLLHE